MAGNSIFQSLVLPIPTAKKDFDLSMLDRSILQPAFSFLFDAMLDSYEAGVWMESERQASVLLDMTWEHLNTGYWKDVPMTWRYVYTLLSLVKAVSEYAIALTHTVKVTVSLETGIDLSAAIKTCDMGLLMGAPLMNNILSKLAVKLQEIQSIQSQSKPDGSQTSKRQKLEINPEIGLLQSDPVLNETFKIKKINCPSLEAFRTNYMNTETPVIIQNAIGFWPAFNEHKWSVDYLKRLAGCRTVPIEIGSKYTEETWSQSLMTLKKFIEKHIESADTTTPVGYLAQHQLFDQIPELQRDFSVPDYCCLGENDDVDINAWFGPKGTLSPLHTDPKHNLLAQVVGRKYLKLYDRKYTHCLYPHDGHILFNTSQVDVENIDYEKFPLVREAVPQECILEEGEMLYIPPRCWHYVRSLSTSFSVSFWWE